jgi:DNA invertase Pin-like site-specific DNA recombinase
MKKPIVRKLRCAVYTRKSTEEGLDMEFNSLDAQREACESYVASQKAEGWLLVPDCYDDGGFSGGTLERAALQRLTADIEARRVDVVVVYKIGSAVTIADGFRETGRGVRPQQSHLRERDSVVQHHDVNGPVDSQHIVVIRPVRARGDRRAQKGMWMGGWAPLGYDIKDRKLLINEAEAATVRALFQRFIRCGIVLGARCGAC